MVAGRRLIIEKLLLGKLVAAVQVVVERLRLHTDGRQLLLLLLFHRRRLTAALAAAGRAAVDAVRAAGAAPLQLHHDGLGGVEEHLNGILVREAAHIDPVHLQ